MTFIKDYDAWRVDDPLPCIGCGKVLEYGTVRIPAKDRDEPRTGDWGLCVHCGELFILDEDLRPAEPTIAQLLHLQESDGWEILEGEQQKIRNTHDIH